MGDTLPSSDCLRANADEEGVHDVLARPILDGNYVESQGQAQAVQPVKRAKFLSLPLLTQRTAAGIGHPARMVQPDLQPKTYNTAASSDVVQQTSVATPPQSLEELYDLNADLLLKVFSFLELEDLCRCAGVSKRWMEASRDPAFWHTLDFSRRKIRPRQVLTLCARYANATSLNLVGVRNVDAAMVRDALGHLTSLVTLSVGDGVIGPSILDEISRMCPPTLRSLCVTDAILGQSVVSDLSLSNTSLTELNLTRCRGVRLQLTLPELSKLVLSGSGLSVVTMAGRPYASLTHVDLSDCIKLSDASMASLLAQCPALTSLDLSGCVSVSDETLQALARHCLELTELSVARCPNVALEEVHLPSLRSANLTGCVGMNSDGARTSLDGWTSLEDLRLDDCILLPSLRLQLPRLRHLSLYNCHKLAILHVAAPRLASLDLSHCCLLSRVHLASNALTRLEWVGLFSLAHATLSCPALTELHVTNCDALLASAFDTLGECPCLATLVVDNCDGLVAARIVDCPALTTLQLTMCKSLASLHVAAPALTQLSLEGSAGLSSVTLDPVGLSQLNLGICPHLVTLQVHAPAMDVLELRGCGMLQDVTVCAPHLSSLDASYCSRLTESFLSNVVASCPRLTTLTLASCPGVLPSLAGLVTPVRRALAVPGAVTSTCPDSQQVPTPGGACPTESPANCGGGDTVACADTSTPRPGSLAGTVDAAVLAGSGGSRGAGAKGADAGGVGAGPPPGLSSSSATDIATPGAGVAAAAAVGVAVAASGAAGIAHVLHANQSPAIAVDRNGCLAHLVGLQGLTRLDLSYTEVRSLGDVFAACASLQVLQLSACKWLERCALAPLCAVQSPLPHLHTLDISYCNVDVVFGGESGEHSSSGGRGGGVSVGVRQGGVCASVVPTSAAGVGRSWHAEGVSTATAVITTNVVNCPHALPAKDAPVSSVPAVKLDGSATPSGSAIAAGGGRRGTDASCEACPTANVATSSGPGSLAAGPRTLPRLMSPLGRLRCVNMSGNKLLDDRLWAFLDEEARVVNGAHVVACVPGQPYSGSSSSCQRAEVGVSGAAGCLHLSPSSTLTGAGSAPDAPQGVAPCSLEALVGVLAAEACAGGECREPRDARSGMVIVGVPRSTTTSTTSTSISTSTSTSMPSEGEQPKRTPTLLTLTCVACPGLHRVSLASRHGLGMLLGSLSLRLSRVVSVRLACPWLATLDLGDCSQLAELFLDCPRLDNLSLQGCAALTPGVLTGALKGAPALETLDLRGCRKVAGTGVQGLYSLCQGLCRVYQ